MKFFVVLLISLFSVCVAKAQKSKYVGHYLMGNHNLDTLDGHLFMSVDSFKLVYQAVIKGGTDYAYPVYKGTWSIDDNHVITFKYKNGGVRTASMVLKTYGNMSLLRITMGDKVYTRSPTDEQMSELHH